MWGRKMKCYIWNFFKKIIVIFLFSSTKNLLCGGEPEANMIVQFVAGAFWNLNPIH